LTFDDGPNEGVTRSLLDTLWRHGDVMATFFLIGEHVDENPDMVREIVRRGHAVANHSYTHADLPNCTREKVREELTRCRDALDRALGGTEEHRSLFRAPYGHVGGTVLDVARELGMRHVTWSVEPKDWDPDPQDGSKPLSSDIIISRTAAVLDRNRPGCEVLLLHDGCPKRERDNPARADRSEMLLAVERLLEKYAGTRSFVGLR
jgi:peptidoglycan/xylan/chitin deacetylase (PgdA/CDA1 family)